MRYCSIDIETTGLSVSECDILEFGAVLDDLTENKNIDSLPVFHCYFVKERYIGEPQALAMHSKIFEKIAARGEEENRKKYHYLSAEKFGNTFKQFLVVNGYETESDRVVINVAGKNFGIFDFQFLKYKTDFEKHIKVRHTILDPAILYLKSSDERMPGLSECKKRAGLFDTVYHDAVNDAKDVVSLMRQKLHPIFLVRS